MLKLANYVMLGPAQAALMATSLFVLQFLFPPVVWVSQAVISLVFLRKGINGGLPVLLLATISFSAMIFFLFGNLLAGLKLVTFFWVPSVILALVLRQTVSLGMSFLAAGLMALLIVLGLYLYLGDPANFWETLVTEQLFKGDLLQNAQIDEALLKESINWAAQVMSGVLATVIMLGSLVGLLLARYWQASIFNPGGFGKEFRELSLGKLPAVLTIGLALLTLVVPLPVFINIAPIAIALFALVGLAILHSLVKAREMNSGWLFGVYLLLMFLLPHTTVLLGALGLADTWLNIRQRINN